MADDAERDPMRAISSAERAYVDEHIDELRPWLAEGRFLRLSLGIALGLGLVAHVIGYVLRIGTPGEPIGLIADLLYAFGLALWTGVVVAFFVQVFPETKRRQVQQYLVAYEAGRRRQEAGAKRSGPAT